jgi:hypothetical protein
MPQIADGHHDLVKQSLTVGCDKTRSYLQLVPPHLAHQVGYKGGCHGNVGIQEEQDFSLS